MDLSRHAHGMLTAVGLLTRIPVSDRTAAPGEAVAPLRDAVPYFPAVGALIGLATGSVIVCASQLWPPTVAVVLGLTFEAVLTGALHEDAVADFCDAFGGGWTREDVLRILKDSRVGSFGALGLGLAVLLRAGATAALPAADLLAVTVAAASWGRWVILPVMALVPTVSDRPGSARDFGQGVSAREVVLGLLWALAAMLPFLAARPANAAAAFLASGVFLAWFVSYLRRRLGGVTGDCLGAACYAGQLLVLLAASARPTGVITIRPEELLQVGPAVRTDLLAGVRDRSAQRTLPKASDRAIRLSRGAGGS